MRTRLFLRVQSKMKLSVPVSFAFLLMCLAFAPAHASETKTADQISDEAVATKTADDAAAADRIGSAFEKAEGEGEAAKPVQPDLAYGAYQRGMYLTAFRLALPRAEAGDAAAQTLIAELYDLGQGIARDTKRAAEWYEVAAKSGNREAQFSYAMKLLQGKDVKQDQERAIELMKQAAEAGHPLAMFNYASHLISQRPTSYGYRKALPFLEKAAEYRLSDAYYSLAKIYNEGLATGIGDPERGRLWLERAARSGVDTAQIELGLALISGLYGERDKEQAFRWFATAAQSGNVIAQNRIAHMFFEGVGVEASPVDGAKWHILASRAGRADLILDNYLRQLDDESKQKALEAANRWPF